jgi:hypothetical protein
MSQAAKSARGTFIINIPQHGTKQIAPATPIAGAFCCWMPPKGIQYASRAAKRS